MVLSERAGANLEPLFRIPSTLNPKLSTLIPYPEPLFRIPSIQGNSQQTFRGLGLTLAIFGGFRVFRVFRVFRIFRVFRVFRVWGARLFEGLTWGSGARSVWLSEC